MKMLKPITPLDLEGASSSFGERLRPMRFFERGVLTPAMQALLDATDCAAHEDNGFALNDVDRVESYWEMLDSLSTAHGFVLALRDGRRVYLQLVVDEYGEDEAGVELQILPMRGERYPELKGGGFVWDDDTRQLNGVLTS